MFAYNTPFLSTPDTNSSRLAAEIGAAASLELSTLQLQSSMVSTLFSGLSGGAAPLGSLLDVRV